ncbi:MAG: hypothetical protein H7A35_15210 [Planctomycetales bacterium]|nr:hypothetical protein [bacterium]UNM08179.1 MAG: hypothetical protein H7A35_15210 [Planctomycetales bacterium]
MKHDDKQHGSPYSSPEEYHRHSRAAFLRAKDRVLREQDHRSQLRRVLVRYAVAIAALVLVIAGVDRFGMQSDDSSSLPGLFGEPAMAGEGNWLFCQVLNSMLGVSLPNVDVFEVSAGGVEHEMPVYVGSSDALGMFTLGGPEIKQDRTFALYWDGNPVGDSISYMPNDPDTERYRRIDLKLSEEQVTLTEGLELQPGEAHSLEDSVSLQLGAEAETVWSGSITRDREWPTNFAYGRVLDGIFEVDGPQSDDLTISVSLQDRKLIARNINPDDIRLIAYSEEYEKDDRQRRSGIHRGWYRTDNPPDEDNGSIKVTKGDSIPELQKEQLDIRRGIGETIASWHPLPGRRYALLAQPVANGNAQWCYEWVADVSSAEAGPYPNLMVYGADPGMLPMYEVYYENQQSGETRTFPTIYWLRRLTGNPLKEGRWKENESDAIIGEPLLMQGKLGSVNGRFTVRLVDFTMTDPAEYESQDADFSVKPLDFDIDIQHEGIGSIAHLTLTCKQGMPDMDSPPEWDINGDLVTDLTGTEVSFQLMSSNSFQFLCLVHPKDRVMQKVVKNVAIPDENRKYFYGMAGLAYPVYQASRTLPASGSKPAISFAAVSNPVQLNEVVSKEIMPLIMLNDDKLHLRKLREMRIYLYAKGENGDYKEIFIAPRVFSMKKPGDGELYFTQRDRNFSIYAGHEGSISFNGNSYALSDSLKYHENPDDDYDSASDYLNSMFTKSPAVRRILYSRGLSTDSLEALLEWEKDRDAPLTQLADWLVEEDKLVEGIREYLDTDVGHIVIVGDEKAEYFWRVPLFDGSLDEDDYLLVSLDMLDHNMLFSAGYTAYSGGDTPSRVEIETTDGEVFTYYWNLLDTGLARAE